MLGREEGACRRTATDDARRRNRRKIRRNEGKKGLNEISDVSPPTYVGVSYGQKMAEQKLNQPIIHEYDTPQRGQKSKRGVDDIMTLKFLWLR